MRVASCDATSVKFSKGHAAVWHANLPGDHSSGDQSLPSQRLAGFLAQMALHEIKRFSNESNSGGQWKALLTGESPARFARQVETP